MSYKARQVPTIAAVLLVALVYVAPAAAAAFAGLDSDFGPSTSDVTTHSDEERRVDLEPVVVGAPDAPPSRHRTAKRHTSGRVGGRVGSEHADDLTRPWICWDFSKLR